MKSLDDPRWEQLIGGYRQPYDASIPLRKLRDGVPPEQIWKELWEELHHQGDVDSASFAVVPHLVSIASQWGERDWNFYAIIALIEIERGQRDNPDVDDSIREDYHAAWGAILDLALHYLRTATDQTLIRTALGVIALQRGDRILGEILTLYDAEEIADIHLEIGGEQASDGKPDNVVS